MLWHLRALFRAVLFMMHDDMLMAGQSALHFLEDANCFDCASHRQVSHQTFSYAQRRRRVPRVSVRPSQSIIVLYITQLYGTTGSAIEAAEREAGPPNLVSPAQARTVHSANESYHYIVFQL